MALGLNLPMDGFGDGGNVQDLGGEGPVLDMTGVVEQLDQINQSLEGIGAAAEGISEAIGELQAFIADNQDMPEEIFRGITEYVEALPSAISDAIRMGLTDNLEEYIGIILDSVADKLSVWCEGSDTCQAAVWFYSHLSTIALVTGVALTTLGVYRGVRGYRRRKKWEGRADNAGAQASDMLLLQKRTNQLMEALLESQGIAIPTKPKDDKEPTQSDNPSTLRHRLTSCGRSSFSRKERNSLGEMEAGAAVGEPKHATIIEMGELVQKI